MSSGAVRGLVAGGYWNDLGTPARYLGANLDVLHGRVPLGRFAGADPLSGKREIAPGVRAAPGARIADGARLVGPALVGEGAAIEAGAEVGPGAIVGSRCIVGAGARVRDAVVWDDTTVAPREVVAGAIAAGSDRVPREVP
jgi:mannose-1-phosphate guanylyltransferase